jgi:steroid 5-alpha reductase family enzyme
VSRLDILLLTFLVSLTAVTACWLYGMRHGHDLSLIDGYYGFASLVHAGLTYLLWPHRTTRGLLLTILVSLWAIGFGQALARRWFAHRGQGGDVRYREAARTLGMEHGFWWKSYGLAAPQALLIALLNLPIQLGIMSDAGGLRLTDFLGFAVIAAGAIIEVTANRQLELYKRSARPGGTLMTGLWAWFRHPNYFGNFTVYLGSVIAASSEPHLWWTVVSPLTILVVLRWGFLGTGVSGTDRLMLAKRADDPVYLDYVRRTPAFVPRPPRRAERSPGIPPDSATQAPGSATSSAGLSSTTPAPNASRPVTSPTNRTPSA